MGIATQDDRYSPFDPRTSILRYWHLIEATLEPPLPSVRSFTRLDGIARSNLEIDGWSQQIAPVQDEIFAGVIDYIGALQPADATVRAESAMTLLVIDELDFSALLDEIPALAHKLLASLATRLRTAEALAFD